MTEWKYEGNENVRYFTFMSHALIMLYTHTLGVYSVAASYMHFCCLFSVTCIYNCSRP